MSRISKVRIELLRLLICVEPTILAKVQSWDGMIACPNEYFYFDYAQDKTP